MARRRQLTGATLLSGGEGVGVGMRSAGIRHLWGIELDPDIVQVARDNKFEVFEDDIVYTDPRKIADYGRPDVLHASPPCQNYSNAKRGVTETEDDYLIADAITHFVTTLRPRVFTLENVAAYRASMCLEIITHTLVSEGYVLNDWVLNAADYGVPQTRKRFFLVAIRCRPGQQCVPCRPPATHIRRANKQVDFLPFGTWCGWYKAIEDLIPSMPDSEIAPWQLKRLPCAVKTMMLRGGNTSTRMCREIDEPSQTITASMYKGMPLLVSGQLSGGKDKRLNIRAGDHPAFTIVSSSASIASNHVIVQSTVKRFTARALARLQAFPDSYKLPKDEKLAVRVIGNAVPPLLYKAVVESGLKQSGMAE